MIPPPAIIVPKPTFDPIMSISNKSPTTIAIIPAILSFFMGSNSWACFVLADIASLINMIVFLFY